MQGKCNEIKSLQANVFELLNSNCSTIDCIGVGGEMKGVVLAYCYGNRATMLRDESSESHFGRAADPRLNFPTHFYIYIIKIVCIYISISTFLKKNQTHTHI